MWSSLSSKQSAVFRLGKRVQVFAGCYWNEARRQHVCQSVQDCSQPLDNPPDTSQPLVLWPRGASINGQWKRRDRNRVCPWPNAIGGRTKGGVVGD